MTRPQNKDEYRQILAEMFAGVLEEKGLSWRKEWQGVGASAPHNGITKACYKGTNAFLLSLVSMVKGYQDPRWFTMVQIMDKGKKYHPKDHWHLKAGTKAIYVEYWYPFDVKQKRALTWEEYKDEIARGRKEESFRLCTKYTAVFNASEVEGLPPYEHTEHKIEADSQVISALSVGMDVPIFYDGGDEAYYSPRRDEIHMPALEAFENEYAFHATALHELAHSSGHPSRLDRLENGMFGSSQYAYEELVAEMAACFMSVNLPVEPTQAHMDNHKAYVQSWIQAIRDKPESLVKAIKDAQTAASFMDWKGGFITEKEYLTHRNSTIIIPTKSARTLDMER
jgi:antirestriction protein ArdC